jgi:predicted enzyme related to lactoylglutathione lyase
MNLNQVTLPVTDFDRTVQFYRDMGFTQIVHSPPRYARFECPEGDSTFSLHSTTEPVQNTGVVVYFECKDLDERVEALRAKGFEFTQLPKAEVWLWREARLNDPSGNVICLFWAGDIRKNPPWKVKPE